MEETDPRNYFLIQFATLSIGTSPSPLANCDRQAQVTRERKSSSEPLVGGDLLVQKAPYPSKTPKTSGAPTALENRRPRFSIPKAASALFLTSLQSKAEVLIYTWKQSLFQSLSYRPKAKQKPLTVTPENRCFSRSQGSTRLIQAAFRRQRFCNNP